MQKLGLVVVMFLFAQAQAATENWKWLNGLPAYEPPTDSFVVQHPFNDDKEFERQMDISKTNRGRKIAQAGNDAVKAPAKLAALIKKINDITTPQALDDLLKDAESDAVYKSYEDTPDAQFLITILAPLRAYRGIFYRLRPMLRQTEGGILRSSGVANSMMVTLARQIAGGTTVYFPQPQWTAGFKYISEPFPNGSDIWAFTDDSKGRTGMMVFQDYLEQTIYRALVKAKDRMYALAEKNTRLVWDNRVIFASESYDDNMDRYRIIGRTECLALYSGYLAGMAGIKFFAAYDMNDLINVTYEIGKTVGFDATVGDVSGLSAMDRRNILMDKKFAKFMTLKKVGSDETASRDRMKASYTDMKESVRVAAVVWEETKGRSDDVWRILDPGAFRPFTRVIDSALGTASSPGTILRIVDSTSPNGEPVKSAVMDKTVHVNINKFFNTDAPSDLKAFLPKLAPEKPENKSEYSDRSVDVGEGRAKRSVPYQTRNYFRGQAQSWEYSAYTKYFPEANNAEGVKLVSRVLMQSWGGAVVGLPLVFAVQ